MAQKLGIADVRFDWREAIKTLQPDIVAIATPAGVHCEIALVAAKLGCHIICEKPLALNAVQAQAMLQAVEQAGVKHGYGATSRYAPAAIYAQTLLAAGLIGQVQEVESIHHFNTSPLSPYSWYFQLSQGGGALYNDFTHFLGQVLFLTGGTLQAVSGTTRQLIDKVPVGPPIHDLRFSRSPAPQASGGPHVASRQCRSGLYDPRTRANAGRQHRRCGFSSLRNGDGYYPNALTFYGSKGSFIWRALSSQKPSSISRPGGTRPSNVGRESRFPMT